MALDLTLRQSLASYGLRSKADVLVPIVSTIEGARSNDEALIANVNREVEIADAKLRAGEAKHAVGVLRRAFGIADDFRRAKQPDPSPAAQAALTTVHMHMCAVLSRLGRHQQALEEARAGCLTSEDLWRTMAKAVAEAEEAEVTSDSTKPIPALKAMLLRPPSWLEQAIETTVHVRQACAIEAELLGDSSLNNVFQFHQRGVYRRNMSDSALLSAAALDCGGGETVVGATGWSLEVDRLHEEALSMARQLLTEDHPARLHAEQVYQKRMGRRAALGLDDGAGSVGGASGSGASSPPGTSARRGNVPAGGRPDEAGAGGSEGGFSAGAADKDEEDPYAPKDPLECSDLFMEGSLLWLRNQGRLPQSPDGGPRSRISAPLQDKLGKLPLPMSPATLSTTASSAGFFNASCMSSSRPSTRSTLASPSQPRVFPRGDVYTVSITEDLPRTSRTSRPSSPSPEARKKIQRQRSQTEKKKPADPFREWAREMDSKKMTYKQYLNKSLDGQVTLKGDLKVESRRFKAGKMRDAYDDALYENRNYFCDFGVAVTKSTERKKERWRTLVYQPSAKEILMKERDKTLLAPYGVPLHPKKGVELKGLIKCLRASQEQTPYGKEMQKKKDEDAKRHAEEERARMFAAISRTNEAAVHEDVQEGVQTKFAEVRRMSQASQMPFL
eukprot:TRINITY_DN14922_c0_g1_i1.p1 TRINITY_DN14922_c0_g1~~TRINITY_DN14922_c0_g1_i1.p1  ORF type:complete len:672 (+),score=150.41 TRINITY_DN14922_c0_g1_i1:157-2172(+)